MKRTRWLVGVLLASLGGLPAQQIRLDDGSAASTARRQHVALATEAVAVQAGKPEWVELRFEVEPGLHINSHTPKDELLIPTTLTLDAVPGVRVVGQEYPAGVPLTLPLGQGEVLSTYQGTFRVRLQLVVPKGEPVLTGSLRYQACDQTSCYPPRTLPVRVAVSAR